LTTKIKDEENKLNGLTDPNQLNILQIVVNGEFLRSLFTMAVIHRTVPFTIAVNGHCKLLSFFILNKRFTTVYDRL